MITANRNLIILILFLTFIFAGFSAIPFTPMLSIGIFLFAFYLFTNQLGKTVPIKELAFLITSIQLLLASFFAFYVQDPDKAFLPKVSPEIYFNYAVPGVLLFILGLYTFKSKLDYAAFQHQLSNYDQTSIAKQLIGIGYVSLIISPFVPGGLRYFFTLLVFLSYIGGIIILISKNSSQVKLLWVGLAFLPVVNDAFFSGIFYLALIWVAFAFLYYMLLFPKSSLMQKFIIISVALYLTLTLDAAKKDFREIVWDKEVQNISLVERTGLLSQLIWERLTFQIFTNENNTSARITRANQGALVTWVMKWVPENEPFANGATIKDAIESALLPRFLFPNKAKAGGKENFEKFTGHELKNTSMNVSLLGEGWANFGYWGGLAFMYCVGLFYSFAIKKFSSLVHSHPIYFYFIPYLFIYIIKSEDDLLTPLNHIFKASLVLYLLHRFYISKIKPIYEAQS